MPGASLWIEPANLATRDLYYGPWGRDHAPDPKAVYTLVERKHTGVNLGMTVTDPEGREWSVKQPYPGNVDSEAPVEVALSRILSAVGYHQPPVYYLPAFTLKDDFGTRTEVGGRFRLKHEDVEGRGFLAVGRESLRRLPALPGPHRDADDVQQHGLEEQQQLAVRAQARGSRRTVVRGPRHRRRARRHAPAWRRERTIPIRSSGIRSFSASTAAASTSRTTAGTGTSSAIESRPLTWHGRATCSVD